MISDGSSRNKGVPSSEERKLELRLGPPGGEEEFWSVKDHVKKFSNRDRDETPVSSSYFSHMASVQSMNKVNSGQKFSSASDPKPAASNGSQKR